MVLSGSESNVFSKMDKTGFSRTIYQINYMGHDATKPVFAFFEKAGLKPVSSATQTS